VRTGQQQRDDAEDSEHEAMAAAFGVEAAGCAASQHEASLKKRKWRGTDDINRQWFQSVGAEMEVDRLAWDLKQEFGRTRPLDDQHMQKSCESLRSPPPTAPIRLERRLYILAGQHKCRAGDKMRLEKWHTLVNADVTQPATPLQHRRTVAGASNARGRIQRATAITECVRQIPRLANEPDMPVNDGILTAVENCGLNGSSSAPVCDSLVSMNAARGVNGCSFAGKFCIHGVRRGVVPNWVHCCDTAVCRYRVPPQFNTVSRWGPLVGVVSYWRYVALDYFEKFKKAQLGLHTFAIMSTVMDPNYPVDCDVRRQVDRVQGGHVDFG
jgi:hypothetical protein